MAANAQEETTLQSRTGISEPVARQSKVLAFSWKALVPADVPLIASVLPTCVELLELDLSHNKLGDAGATAVAKALTAAGRKLATVRLPRNRITDKGGSALAAFLADASASGSLARLDLSLNALRSDTALGRALATNTGLVELDLSSNALRSGQAIASALRKNRTLRHGHLLFNPLDVASAAALADALRSSRANGIPLTLCGIDQEATTVLFARRGMRSSDAIMLAAELETAPSVTTVDLSYNMLGPEAAAALARALRHSRTLRSLKLQSNRLAGSWLDFGDEVGERNDGGILEIARALAEENTLTALDLSLNTVGETGARALAAAVAAADPTDPLRLLHVGSGGEALPVQPLRGLAVRGEVQSSINLSGRRLDDLDAVVVSTLIASNSRLMILDLSGSSIGTIGCHALARALRSEHCQLTQLDLRGKGMLGEPGKLAIGQALSAPGSARVGCLACDHFTLGPQTAALDLPGAMLSLADVILLAGVLHHNHALLSLDLSNNGLGPPACTALCAALSRNSALIELDVYGNELTDDGAKLIADTLRANSTLTALALGLNGMSAEGVRRICHALENNASLVALSLENNGASTFTETHANSLLASNRRRAAVVRHLPALGGGADLRTPASRLHVHLCGEPGSGKTALAGALRRSGVGQMAKEDTAHDRTRGVVEHTQRYESRTFVVADYGGKSEFALMHHRHHDRNARALLAPAVYVIVVNLMAGFEAGAEEVRWWRRYLRALMPRGTVPPIALVGSRADRCAKPTQLLQALREHANFDGSELPEISTALAFDCRGAAWPLRDWYVQQHDALVSVAPAVPKVIDSILTRKEAWAEKKLRTLPWTDFCARLRKEVRDLASADEYAMRAVISYLHDMSVLLLAEVGQGGGRSGSAEACVILDVPWFYSSIVTDLLIPLGGAVDPSGRFTRPAGGGAAAPLAATMAAAPPGGATGATGPVPTCLASAAHAFASAAADRYDAQAAEAMAAAGLSQAQVDAAMAPVDAALSDLHGGAGPDGGGSPPDAAAAGDVTADAVRNAALLAAAGVPRPEAVAVSSDPHRNPLGSPPSPVAPSPAAAAPPAPPPHAGASSSFTPAQLAARCRAAAQLGDEPGLKLSQMLCDLGVCCPVHTEGPGAAGHEGAAAYVVPPPLTSRAARVSQQTTAAAADLRGKLRIHAGRRFVGRSADDTLLVPSLLPRLHARAAQEPAAREEPESRQILRDGKGHLLLGRHGACCVLQCVELADGRDAVDVFACARRPGSLPFLMLNDALELLRLCVAECAPGVQPEHHVIGAAGLDESYPPDMRPTAPIGVVRAACKARKAHVHFGGQNQSILQLLGDDEVRQTLLTAPPPKATKPAPSPRNRPKPTASVADVVAAAAAREREVAEASGKANKGASGGGSVLGAATGNKGK